VVEEQQLSLKWDVYPEDGKGEARTVPVEGHQTLAAPIETRPGTRNLMKEAVEEENLAKALKRVVANKGAPGIDGMTVEELPNHLSAHWLRIKEELLTATYKPAPVKKVDISKPDGGTRTLGIPTVVDRLIQQMILQVLNPILEPTFSESSYGYRLGRSAKDAVEAAKGYVADGYEWVVDLDIEAFFDRVNHDKLMAKLAKLVKHRFS
jgi:RNA-directed DNA polymerase